MIYTAIIPIGEARREGRQPSHDGEYLRLYWHSERREYGQPQWILEDNAGVAASHHSNYLDAFHDACPTCEFDEEGEPADEAEALAEAQEIQAEIDTLIESEGAPADVERMGAEARQHAIQWGWLPIPVPRS